ncbi:MAG TPA: hypothetical protein VJ809_07815, partial [Pirellulales bacterium]|nr:hypothetical protein [Pirellulales bacterium]
RAESTPLGNAYPQPVTTRVLATTGYMRYRSVSPSQNRHKWFSLKELSPAEEAKRAKIKYIARLKSDKTEQCFT